MPGLPPVTMDICDRLVPLLQLQKHISDGTADDLGRRQTHVLVSVLGAAVTRDMPEMEQMELFISVTDSLISRQAISLAVMEAASQQLFRSFPTIEPAAGTASPPNPFPAVSSNVNGAGGGMVWNNNFAPIFAHADNQIIQNQPALLFLVWNRLPSVGAVPILNWLVLGAPVCAS
jgi:hypothetical protein